LASGLRLPHALLKRDRRQPGVEMPPVPLAVRRAGQVALGASARVRLGCAR
jgi:hypothetical protein